MAEITSGLMYKSMKRIHSDIPLLEDGQRDIKAEINVVRGTAVLIQQGIHNIAGVLANHDQRLDRIERRLDLRGLAEAVVSVEYQPQ